MVSALIYLAKLSTKSLNDHFLYSDVNDFKIIIVPVFGKSLFMELEIHLGGVSRTAVGGDI